MWGLAILLASLVSFHGTEGVEILVVTNKGIVLYNTTSGRRSNLMSEHELVMKEVDYHVAREEVYVLTKRQILRCPFSWTSSNEYRPVMYSEDEYNYLSLAVDWLHGTIFWVSGAVFTIHRSDLEGKNHRVIYRGFYIENFHRKLLVDPEAGFLFWATSNKIFSCDIEGNKLQEIQFPEVLGTARSRVKYLALDVTQHRLYFMAGFDDDDVWLLMSGNYDGSGFRRHDAVARYTYAMAALGDELYWVSKERELQTFSPRTTRRFHNLVLYKGSIKIPGAIQRVMDLNVGSVWNMKIYHPDLQRPRNSTSSS